MLIHERSRVGGGALANWHAFFAAACIVALLVASCNARAQSGPPPAIPITPGVYNV